MIQTAVVILNWNGITFLRKFLGKVVEDSYNEHTDVFVIDNASSDESLEYIKENHPLVKTIVHFKNLGFAEGYNKGLELIQAQYFILLNSDVETTPNWINPLISVLESENSIAVCCPKLKSYDNKDYFEYAGAAGGYIDKYGYPFCQGRLFDAIEKDNEQYNITKDIFWSTGAAFCIRSSVYKEVGGLDKDFFAHMEEIDLCWRIKNQGHRIVYVHNSTAFHVGGGTLPKENPFKTYLNFRNNLYLLYKNLPQKNLKTTLFQRKILDGIAFIMFLSKLDVKNCKAIWKAHIDFYKNIKYLKTKRIDLEAKRKINFHKEIYAKSIVFDYFIKRKRTITL